jgi:histidinol phosphatase-like PHP family hydrolase
MKNYRFAVIVEKDEDLDLIRFGIGVARRGWCEARHILNTSPAQEVEAFLRHH